MARYYSINLEISRNSTTLGLKALLQAQCYSVHADHQVGYGTYQLECVWLKNALLPIVAAFRLALRWMCDSSETECARRTSPIYLLWEKTIIAWSRRSVFAASLLATVWNFAHSPHMLSDPNTIRENVLVNRTTLRPITLAFRQHFLT